MIAAAKPTLFRNGKSCGQVFEVTCTGAAAQGAKPVRVTVIDSCSPTKKESCPSFVLSKEAFAAIANPDAGLITISFKPYVTFYYYYYYYYYFAFFLYA
ncbi:Putative EG45-like domain containing protein 1 [Linum perenne]